MMLTLLGFAKTAGGFLKSLPWQAYAGLAAAAFIWWYGGHQFDRGYDKRTAEYVALNEEAQEKATVGGLKAEQAAKATVTAIEAENARAVEAASNSDDPLKAALDAL